MNPALLKAKGRILGIVRLKMTIEGRVE